MFQDLEKRRFDALEPEHLARLEAERIGRNDSRMRFLGRLLAEQGMTEQADEVLAIRNDCAAKGTDAGGDLRIHRLIDDAKHNLIDPKLRLAIPEPYINIEDLIDRLNWNKFRSLWEAWENIVSILDHRLIAICITGRPDGTIVDFKGELDDLRDEVVTALRPFAHWYSWHLDVSVLRDNRHPHYHCLFVVPATADRAVFDVVEDLRQRAFWNDDGLYIQYRDWLDGDRRRRMLDVAERQRSWIAALAYATRVISYRPLPKAKVKAVPTLSSFLDVDDHVGQVRKEWDAALNEVLKRNDLEKALGARRMALFLREETGRRVVSFRQSRRWKALEPAVRPGRPLPAPLPSLSVADDDEGDPNSLVNTLHAAVLLYGAVAPVVTDGEIERGSEMAVEELEQNDSRPADEPVPDDDSLPSIVIEKGFEENPVGRPHRAISHQELMLAIINGGTCTAAAAILETSTRKVRQEMEGAGIAPFPRGRPKAGVMRDLPSRPRLFSA
ncbi:hypothetical protein [Bosea sp. 124]|uniref:hypothetical protein n=1 Tax=Bosea sp. 124 TaxID=2135642 RepID=UPI000D3AD4F3|nr:hypothetical protein [Bosea sp. 124]